MKSFLFFLLFSFLYNFAFANECIDVAEAFFINMKKRDYSDIFEQLTLKSQDVIISEVYDAISKSDMSVTKESLRFDFKNGGEISKSYWQGFLKNFNPDMVLIDSLWNLGRYEEKYCEVVITYKKSKSQKPALLKLYRESSLWKIGIVESFWTRKK